MENTFGENMSPSTTIGRQFDGDLGRIEGIDQSPSRFHLWPGTRIESEWSLIGIVFTRRSSTTNNNPAWKKKKIRKNSNVSKRGES